tara:strand:- start:9597 stop:11066 length:1470 start_codon:yes stop_codon:yes gene_type:complete
MKTPPLSFVVIVVSSILASAADRPNIVFLLADDMGYGDLACYGHPVIQSPHLDQLAKDGMRLTDCYSASPNCSPSRTAILTGRSPYRVGMYDFARFKALHIPKSELTVAEVIRDAGYQTMFAGKWHCSGDFQNHPNPGDHGFEHWLAHPKNFGHNPGGFYRNGRALPKLHGWMSEIVVDEAIDYISKRDPSKPFMTMLWFSEPHTPVVAADEFKRPYQNEKTKEAAKSIRYGGSQVIRKPKEENRATYYGCVSMLDHHIGWLMAHLKKENLENNTLVIFTSDNGPEHRPATSFGTPGILRGAKGHMHEGGYRVPGIIKWPGRIKAGTVSDEPVNGTDFLPTLAAVVGAKPNYPNKIDGADVSCALVDGKSVKRPTPMMWWLYHARGAKEVSMRLGDYKMLANMLPQKEITVRDAAPPADVKLMDFIKDSDLGNFTLYNLSKDPAETTELSAREPEKFSSMRGRMIELHSEIRAEGPYYELRSSRKKKKK